MESPAGGAKPSQKCGGFFVLYIVRIYLKTNSNYYFRF